MKIGLVSGCFDWLAPGHVRLLKAARGRCDRLHLLMADDDTVRHYKGACRPLLTFEERRELAEACQYVDFVHKLRKVPNETNQLQLIGKILPHFYFEGYDATDEDIGEYLIEYGIERVTLYTEPLHVSDILARYDKRRYDPTQIHNEHIRLGEIAGL